eukprot:4964047-Prymnesium_polylepis.1
MAGCIAECPFARPFEADPPLTIEFDGACAPWRASPRFRAMLHIGFAAALSSTACADDAAHASECVAWAEAGECPINRAFMQENCRLACGLCDAGRGTSPADEQPGTCTDPAATGCSAAGKDTSTCVDEHASCTEWASSGECETNPTYMAH